MRTLLPEPELAQISALAFSRLASKGEYGSRCAVWCMPQSQRLALHSAPRHLQRHQIRGVFAEQIHFTTITRCKTRAMC